MLVLAFEVALQKPGSRILYLAPHQKNAEEIATDIAAHVLFDCPPSVKPEFKSQSKEFHFKNGSIIRLKGVNGEHAKYLRGGAADLIILDECGTMDDLGHVVKDVCLPMTLSTGGRIIMATTPARTPGHASTAFYEECASTNSVAKFTILDTSRYTVAEKMEMFVGSGEEVSRAEGIATGACLPTTTTVQREYFCEFVTDSSAAVIPEFTKDLEKEIVKSHPRPDFYDSYVSMDPGFKDRTAVVYGFWDFVNAKLIIEDESLLTGPNTQDIAKEIKDKEAALWMGKVPFLRVSDVDLRLIADLWQMHQLQFSPARKEDSLGAINLMRNMVQNREIIINPRCVNLIRQMHNAIWNNKATDFARVSVKDSESSMNVDGHYDLVAALKYLCRSVIRTKNPYPAHYYVQGGKFGVPNGHWISPKMAKKRSMGLLSDTPYGRKVLKRGG